MLKREKVNLKFPRSISISIKDFGVGSLNPVRPFIPKMKAEDKQPRAKAKAKAKLRAKSKASPKAQAAPVTPVQRSKRPRT
jgi:hypothetical protein